MAESLYYFVPRAAASTGRYVCNAALTLLAAGLACLALLWVFRAPIAEHFSNPALGDLLVLLGVYLTLMPRRNRARDHDDLAQAAHERGDRLCTL
jgi:uncharacterized membrane protein YfcA